MKHNNVNIFHPTETSSSFLSPFFPLSISKPIYIKSYQIHFNSFLQSLNILLYQTSPQQIPIPNIIPSSNKMYSSSSSSSYKLEITIRSAESLTMGRKNPVRKNLFVTISLEDGRNYHIEKQQRTKVCQEDESYHPAWDEKFTMDVPMQVKFIVLEVHCSTWSGDKTVGVAKVLVSDFVGNSNTPLDYLHFLSYRLRDANGNPNGIVNFSVKILKGSDFGYSCGAQNNYYNNGANDIHSYGNKENCVPKHRQQPWQPTPSVGYPRNSSAAVVGVPAAWYST